MKDDKFRKLTKKQKLSIKPIVSWNKVEKVTIALFIPLRQKYDGYAMSTFFVKNSNNEWHRLMNYDCFRFINSHSYLKGDFENHGVQFLL